jgi:hypothetical protein
VLPMDCLCEEHRTARRHTGLSDAPGIVALTTSSRWHCGEKRCDFRSVRCEKPARQRSSVVSEQQLGAPDSEQCTVRCAVGSSSFSPTARFVLGAINTPQLAISRCGSPRDII